MKKIKEKNKIITPIDIVYIIALALNVILYNTYSGIIIKILLFCGIMSVVMLLMYIFKYITSKEEKSKNIEKIKKTLWLHTLPAEEENTLEEFAWAFGEDTVNEIEKRVHQVISHLHHWPELEAISESGLARQMRAWHNLGVIDEDEVLRRMELHLDELSANLEEDKNKQLIFQMIEKRRQHLEMELKQENPEIWQKLVESRKHLERRLEKQNPEAAKRLHELEEKFLG